MKKPIILILFFSLVSVVYAGRDIELPFEEKFDSGDTWTADLAWVVNGATATHIPSSGCWSGGCAKFTPPYELSVGGNGTYCGMGQFHFDATTQFNVRLLVKLGPTFIETIDLDTSTINKFIIVEGTSRLGILGLCAPSDAYEDPPSLVGLGPSDGGSGGYVYTHDYGDWRDGIPQNAEFKIGAIAGYINEWIAVEYELNSTTPHARMYIWTQDGVFNGEVIYLDTPAIPSATYIDILGGYYNTRHLNQDSDTYMMIDELKMSNSYIGPPAGFGDSSKTLNGISGSGIDTTQ